jgi:hypothetical protein
VATEVIYKDYDGLLTMTLRRNQLTLFSLEGSALPLGYERHVADFGDDFQWRSEEERIQYSLQLAVDVLASWEIHIRKSSYSLPHFGAIHMEDDWLTGIGRSTPCVVMRNAGFIDPAETPAPPPVDVSWKSGRLLGPLTTFVSGKCAQAPRYRRFYILSEVKQLEPKIEARLGILQTYPSAS